MSELKKAKLRARTDIAIEIGTSDLVAIRVAQVERDLTAKRKEAEKKQREVTKVQKEAARERDELVVVLVETEIPQIAQATTAMETLGLKGPTSTSKIDEKGGKLVVTISAPQPSGGYGNPQTSTKTLTLTTAIREKVETIRELDDEIAAIKDELVDIRKELGGLGRVERQAKAAIATNVLRDMEGGAELIEAAQDGDIGVEGSQKLLESDNNS